MAQEICSPSCLVWYCFFSLTPLNFAKALDSAPNVCNNVLWSIQTYSVSLITKQNAQNMMTSSNGNIFRVTGPLWGEFTGDRWTPLTKASDAELWCFLSSVPEQMVEKPLRRRWFETSLRSLWRHCDEPCLFNFAVNTEAVGGLASLGAMLFSDKRMVKIYSISQEICTRFCCALLCCGYVIVHNEFKWSIYPYSSGLLCWHWGNRQIATVPVK